MLELGRTFIMCIAPYDRMTNELFSFHSINYQTVIIFTKKQRTMNLCDMRFNLIQWIEKNQLPSMQWEILYCECLDSVDPVLRSKAVTTTVTDRT